ncbi:hypothetical protein [Shivajiella indica]|uniref:Viral A-type inclusion protein n=1 Tax=Shivajiella indica TaxID=872115 RepID=A0ABW5BA13_9BACT
MKCILMSTRIFFLLVLFSCNSERPDEISNLKDEVIGIHDEVMPFMGELKSLKKEVEIKSKSLHEEDSIQYQGKIEELDSLANQLDSAFEGMFIWMRQYKSPEEDADKNEAKKYLLEQKEKVEVVNQDIKNALALARKELGKD